MFEGGCAVLMGGRLVAAGWQGCPRFCHFVCGGLPFDVSRLRTGVLVCVSGVSPKLFRSLAGDPASPMKPARTRKFGVFLFVRRWEPAVAEEKMCLAYPSLPCGFHRCECMVRACVLFLEATGQASGWFFLGKPKGKRFWGPDIILAHTHHIIWACRFFWDPLKR